MNAKKLLIICFSFPPSPGIGGRRWAKFANYLLKTGIDVQVLAAKYEGKLVSDWYKDTERLAFENRVHFFKSGFPSIITGSPSNFYQKIKYHITLFYLKFKIPGNYYDRSALCKKYLLTEVEKIIEKGYKHIIITIGPFMYAHHLLSIRKNHPDVKLYLDVRDPWTNNKTAFGYNTLVEKRFKFEKVAEKKVAEGYDKILTVADDIGMYFVSAYNIPLEKIVTIKNGYDSLDFINSPILTESRKILLFTGNLYQKAENSFLMFVNNLKKMKRENSQFFNQYECHFYGEIHPEMAIYFAPELNLFHRGRITLDKVFTKIAQSSACLLFLTDDLNYSFSTKFYEYLSHKKPIIVYSKPGKAGEFVETNNLGRQANEDNLTEIINQIENDFFYKKNFDISQFEIQNLTVNLLKAIEFIEN